MVGIDKPSIPSKAGNAPSKGAKKKKTKVSSDRALSRDAVKKKIFRSFSSKPIAGSIHTLYELIGTTQDEVEKLFNDIPDKKFRDMTSQSQGSYLERSGILDSFTEWSSQTFRDEYHQSVEKRKLAIEQNSNKSTKARKQRESKTTVDVNTQFTPNEFLDLLYTQREYEQVLQLIVCAGGVHKRYLEHARCVRVKLGSRSPVTVAGWQKAEITFRDANDLTPTHDPKSNIGANGKAKFLLSKRTVGDRASTCIALDAGSLPSKGKYSPLLRAATEGSTSGPSGGHVAVRSKNEGAQKTEHSPPDGPKDDFKPA